MAMRAGASSADTVTLETKSEATDTTPTARHAARATAFD
jgi:hypothetical protein